MTSPWRTRLAGNRSPLGLLLRSIPSKSPSFAIARNGWVDNDDLVGLVRRHPEVVVLIEDQAVGAVDAVHEDRRGSEAYVKMARSTAWARGSRWRSGAKSLIKPVT